MISFIGRMSADLNEMINYLGTGTMWIVFCVVLITKCEITVKIRTNREKCLIHRTYYESIIRFDGLFK